MGLTKKILFLILLSCVLFSVLFFILFRFILAAPIVEQKALRAQQLMVNALSVLENETKRILMLTEDWAMWDSMYNYTSKPTPEFEIDLGPKQAIKDADLSLFVVLDKKKKNDYPSGL